MSMVHPFGALIKPGFEVRPMGFRDYMIDPIGAGVKTQTRRIAPQPEFLAEYGGRDFHQRSRHYWRRLDVAPVVSFGVEAVGERYPAFRCPKGGPGDGLYVREPWTVTEASTHHRLRAAQAIEVEYREVAGLPTRRQFACLDRSTYVDSDGGQRQLGKVRPAIFMPQLMSRILLEITDVRVERVSAISEADAIAEGCSDFEEKPAPPAWRLVGRETVRYARLPQVEYRHLWNAINGGWQKVNKEDQVRPGIEWVCYPFREEDTPELPRGVDPETCQAIADPFVWVYAFRLLPLGGLPQLCCGGGGIK